jgi:hypothetical protein
MHDATCRRGYIPNSSRIGKATNKMDLTAAGKIDPSTVKMLIIATTGLIAVGLIVAARQGSLSR